MITFMEQVSVAAPLAVAPFAASGRAGLVAVDPVNGFCTPGCGPLAPQAADSRIDTMIGEIDSLARRFTDAGLPVQVFLDTHVPGRAEPPYPPHCEIGSGQENIVPALAWLEGRDGVEFLRKDVINGVIGAIGRDGSNALFEWIRRHGIEDLIFTGICTDICVADAVLTMLSARNHYFGDEPMLPGLRNIVVYEPGCATYHLPADTVRALGLPSTAVHDRDFFHHAGLAIMQSRGAIIASAIDGL